MNINIEMMKTVLKLGLILMICVSMSGCSDTMSWQEEVLLHDGNKIIVNRHQFFGGGHEYDQHPPIKEHSVTFTPAGSSKPITWISEFSKDIGHSNFTLLALDIVNGAAYIAALPTGCFSYNKWGRPNPPYVFFKYVNEQWKQIGLAEFPAEIKEPNILMSTYGHAEVNQIVKSGFVSAASVKKLNSTSTQEELKSIVRMPVKNVSVDCGVLVRIEGGWQSPGGAKAPIPITSQKSISTNN